MTKLAMTNPHNLPRSVRIAQNLFFVNAVIWLIFGGWSLLRLATQPAAQWITLLVIALLMFANVGAMLVAGIGIGRQSRLAFYFGIAVLAINILLTFTDEFGFFDLITLLIDMILLAILIFSRSNYHSTQPAIAGSRE